MKSPWPQGKYEYDYRAYLPQRQLSEQLLGRWSHRINAHRFYGLQPELWGPIIMPNGDNFVLTPIAPHNLTMRPFVINDSNTLRMQVESRENEFLASLDSRIHSFTTETELLIQKADFRIALVQTELQDFRPRCATN